MLHWAWLAGIHLLHGRGPRGNTARKLPWPEHRDIPGQGVPCSAERTGGRGRKGLEHSWGTGRASACWGMCCITSWVWFFFPSVLFLNFVQLTSFLASALSVLLSIPADSEQGAVWELSCWLGWTSSAGLWCSAKHSTYQGNCSFHGEKLQIPHSTTWSLIGNRFTLEKRHNSSVCNWGEKLCSGGGSSYPECPEDGR